MPLHTADAVATAPRLVVFFGSDATLAPDGAWRDVADQVRIISESRPDLRFGPLIETLDKRDPVDWDPEKGK